MDASAVIIAYTRSRWGMTRASRSTRLTSASWCGSTASGSHLAIDLSACTFLDSSGMRAIAAAAERHPRVSIVATDPGILRILEITALDTMLPVHASLDEVR